LTLGDSFNYPVDNLPKSLTNLKFGNNFSQEVVNLPMGLKELKFGNDFCQDVNNLPSSLLNLVFGYSFNKSVERFLGNLEKFFIFREYELKENLGSKLSINYLCSYKNGK